MRIALACLLFLAPEKAWELNYRFKKGMSYEDVQTRVFELTVTDAGRRFVWHNTRNIHMRRTILEVDDTAHPKAERVQVIEYNLNVKASPKDDELGIKREPSEGNRRASSSGVSLARAARIGVLLFGLVLAAIAVAALMTDGSPHQPFDYDVF